MSRAAPIRRGMLAVLALVAVYAAYRGGITRHLDRVAPERHRIYGIPIAVSKDVYLLDGYVAFQSIARRFVNDKPIDAILSLDLPKSANGEVVVPPEERAEGLFFVPADDKGDVTFTRVAFRLFGLSLESLYRLYFLLLLGSVVTFIVSFRKDIERLFIGLAVLLSYYSLLSAFQDGLLPPQVVTFYDARIYGVVAALAVLHLFFYCVDRERFSILKGIGALYQASMIVLAVHVRSANLWTVIALLVGVVVAGLVKKLRSERDRQTDELSGASRRLVVIWPLAVAGFVLSGLLVWERATYHREYFASHMAHHLFWHNAGLGFALHPKLGKPYGYRTADDAMMNRVAGYLIAKGDRGRTARIFGNSYSNETGTAEGAKVAVGPFLHSATSDLELYDETARKVVLETVETHPLETAALFLYYKPRYFLAHLLWFTAWEAYDQPFVDQTGHQSPLFKGRDDTRARRIYFSPLPWTGLAIFAAGLALISPARSSRLRAGLLVTLMLFLWSLLPMIIAYPAPPFMGEPMFYLTVSLYLAIATAWSSIPWRGMQRIGS